MVAKLLKACIALAGATVTSGMVLKSPVLVNAGINMSLSSSLSYAIVDRERQATKQKLNSLIPVEQQLENINNSKFADINRELEDINETIRIYKQQLNKQRGHYFSTDEKLKRLEKKHKQQTTAIAKQVDKLIDLAQNNSQTAVVSGDDSVEDSLFDSNYYRLYRR